MDSEIGREVFEYARRGLSSDLKQALLESHPDRYVAYDGSSAFLMAVKNGHTSSAELLYSKGADASRRTDDGSTALLLAAATGNVVLVELLLKVRLCDLNEPNEDGFTPLDIAHHYQHLEIVAVLKSHGGQHGVSQTQCSSGEVICGPSEKWGYGVFD